MLPAKLFSSNLSDKMDQEFEKRLLRQVNGQSPVGSAIPKVLSNFVFFFVVFHLDN